MKKISLQINASDRRSHINPEIYGHFSEHLGRCIYNGIYVGEDSPISNKNGVRTDVIEAGRAAALRMSITGRTESAKNPPERRW